MTMPGNGWSASPLRYGGDRGSIAKSLVQRRWQRGLHRLSGIGRNVKDPYFPDQAKGSIGTVSPSLASPHLIQGATKIGQLPSAGCCLMMGKSVLGRGELDQQTFPWEGECDFRIVPYTSGHSDGRVELWLCCHARSS